MRKWTLLTFLFFVGSLLPACGLIQPQSITAKVTSVVLETAVVTPAPPIDFEVHVDQRAPLLVARAVHTATRLTDGRVLLVGGSQASGEELASVEIYDPVSEKTASLAPLHTARRGHTASLLPGNRVLVVGGFNTSQASLTDAEVYDPSSNSWTVIPPLSSHGDSHTATVLNDGRVLVVGGKIRIVDCTDQVEIFDPKTNAWTNAAALPGERAYHTAVLLDDDRVLLAGGLSGTGAPAGGDALLYDPQANIWRPTGPMVTPRAFAQLVRLPDGRVLVAGGMALADLVSLTLTSSVEVYNPATNKWSALPYLSQPRYAFSLVLTPEGRVLAIGGLRDYAEHIKASSFISEIEGYDPQANRWSVVGRLPRPEVYGTVTLLKDGRVWMAGGASGLSGEDVGSLTWFITSSLAQP